MSLASECLNLLRVCGTNSTEFGNILVHEYAKINSSSTDSEPAEHHQHQNSNKIWRLTENLNAAIWDTAEFISLHITFGTALMSCAVVLLLFGIWVLFYVPFDWTKDLTEVGYNHVSTKKRVTKRDAINRVRRLRKSGNKVPPPYPNGWFALLESKELKAGQAESINALGQTFAVFRSNETGEVHILDAHCPHLGANIAVGGIVKGDCIECPFHQWVFSGVDGQCTNIPYSTTGVIPKSARIKKWKSCEANGSIFVWHHVESEEVLWEIPVINQIKTNEWLYHGRNEFLVNCHIQDIPENGADVAHLASVHGPNMLSGSDLRFSRAAWAAFVIHSWQAQWQPPTDETESKHIATMTLSHCVRIFNKIDMGNVDVKARQIGPGYVELMMESSFGPFVVVQTVTPVEPLVQQVIHRFYSPRSTAWFSKFGVWAESIMFERDMMVWNSKQYVDTPLLVKEDRLIKGYRNWYSQFYSANSISFNLAKEDMDW